MVFVKVSPRSTVDVDVDVDVDVGVGVTGGGKATENGIGGTSWNCNLKTWSISSSLNDPLTATTTGDEFLPLLADDRDGLR
jgi:hypothetical protein